MSTKKVPSQLKEILKTYFDGCNPASLPAPEKLRAVIWRAVNCNIPCFEVWACGQAVEFPSISAEAVEFDGAGAGCGIGEATTYVRRAPGSAINVDDFTHDFYWKRGRYDQLIDMIEKRDTSVWVLQSFDSDGNSEELIFRGFPTSVGKTVGGSRDSDASMIPVTFAIDGRPQRLTNTTIQECTPADVPNEVA